MAKGVSNGAGAVSRASNRRTWDLQEDRIVTDYMKNRTNKNNIKPYIHDIKNALEQEGYIRKVWQIAERWRNVLRPGLDLSPIRPIERLIIFQANKNRGNAILLKWVAILDSYFPNRSASQLKNAYRTVNPNSRHHSSWPAAESIKLLIEVKLEGWSKDWTQVAKSFPRRKPAQLKDHWHKLIAPSLKISEDQLHDDFNKFFHCHRQSPDLANRSVPSLSIPPVPRYSDSQQRSSAPNACLTLQDETDRPLGSPAENALLQPLPPPPQHCAVDVKRPYSPGLWELAFFGDGISSAPSMSQTHVLNHN